MSECSCWVEYPNPMHKNKNGKWKCVDDYECIQNLKIRETKIGVSCVVRKTHCKRKKEEEEVITPAKLEDIMEEYRDQIKNTDRQTWKDDIRRKALNDVVDVLKQFGFDSGAEIFKEVMKK